MRFLFFKRLLDRILQGGPEPGGNAAKRHERLRDEPDIDLTGPLTSGPFAVAPPPREISEQLKRKWSRKDAARETRHILRSEDIPPGEIGQFVRDHIAAGEDGEDADGGRVHLPDRPWE